MTRGRRGAEHRQRRNHEQRGGRVRPEQHDACEHEARGRLRHARAHEVRVQGIRALEAEDLDQRGEIGAEREQREGRQSDRRERDAEAAATQHGVARLAEARRARARDEDQERDAADRERLRGQGAAAEHHGEVAEEIDEERHASPTARAL